MSTSSQLRLTVILLGAIASLSSATFAVAGFVPTSRLAIAQFPEEALPESETPPTGSPTLELGTKGDVVKELQTVLKRLEYYDGEETGEYDEATQQAVADFQADSDLEVTGVFDVQTFDVLEKRNRKAQKKAAKRAALQAHKRRRMMLLGVGGTVGLTGLIGGTYFLYRFVNQVNANAENVEDIGDDAIAPATSKFVTPLPAEPLPPRQPLQLSPIQELQPVQPPRFETITVVDDTPTVVTPPAAISQPPSPTPEAATLNSDVWHGEATPATAHSEEAEVEPPIQDSPSQPVLTKPPTASGAITTTNGHGAAIQASDPLPPADPVETLIRELQSPHPEKRRRAIWDLAQQSDSRAVQPLVNLLLDSDSQQQSLVLEALSQIGVRTLKPINRALALSLQDDNSQVRKNAIRDVTRIYELISQLSQLIFYATEDPDAEVQETAKWALEQIKNIRIPHQSGS